MSGLTVLQRIALIKKADSLVGSVALQHGHPDMTATIARNVLKEARQARETVAVAENDPPDLHRAVEALRINETTLLGISGAKGWQ